MYYPGMLYVYAAIIVLGVFALGRTYERRKVATILAPHLRSMFLGVYRHARDQLPDEPLTTDDALDHIESQIEGMSWTINLLSKGKNGAIHK